MGDREQHLTRAIAGVLGLRRAERLAGTAVRAEIAVARAYLEELVGPTVARAQAARLLGVSQTALDRWIAKGEVAVVLTPGGRREVPRSELLGLLEEMQADNPEGTRLALSQIIRARRRRAGQLVDVGRLLPRRRHRADGHGTAEAKALVYHRLVAERLDPAIVAAARERLARWREQGSIHPRWADEWERVLAEPLPSIARAIGADTPRARALRQSSPFAGVLTEQERRRVLRAVAERSSA